MYVVTKLLNKLYAGLYTYVTKNSVLHMYTLMYILFVAYKLKLITRF